MPEDKNDRVNFKTTLSWVMISPARWVWKKSGTKMRIAEVVFVVLLIVGVASGHSGGPKSTVAGGSAATASKTGSNTSAAVAAPAKPAAPVNGDTNPKTRLQAMLNKLSGTGTGDAFLVDDCSSNNDFNGQKGYDCHVFTASKSYDTWHIEIASDGYQASAWNKKTPDSSTVCDPACG